MKRILLLFIYIINLNIPGWSQKIIVPSIPKSTNYPEINGQIWYRGFGDNQLTTDNLKILENNKPIEFTLNPVDNNSPVAKNKRILILVENHWLPIGNEERKFFKDVISKGIKSELNEGDEFAVYSFDWFRQGHYIFQESKEFTSSYDDIIQAVNKINAKSNLNQPQVGADINQALMESIKLLSDKNDSMASAIFLFSDELDNIVGKVPPVDVKLESQKNNIPIYAISFYHSNRYSKVLQDQICLPSYGEYFSDKSNSVGMASEKLSEFLSHVIENNRGSLYEYKYKSKLPKSTSDIELQFEVKKIGAIEKVALNFPSLKPWEWAMANPLIFAILSTVILFLGIVIYIYTKKTKRKNKLQQDELNRTQKELEAQSAKAEIEKRENQERFNKLQQEKLEKEKAQENLERLKIEEKLLQLMLIKGSFPKLNYSYNSINGSIEVNHPHFTIGREKNNCFYIQINTVSKKHATIIFNENGTYTLVDNQSSNGTYVNGLKISETLLKNGDHIIIGEIEMTFQN